MLGKQTVCLRQLGGNRAVFNETECNVLSIAIKKLEGQTEKQKNPYHPRQLSWASWIIARLGGWKRYKSESPPLDQLRCSGDSKNFSLSSKTTYLQTCMHRLALAERRNFNIKSLIRLFILTRRHIIFRIFIIQKLINTCRARWVMIIFYIIRFYTKAVIMSCNNM